MQRTAIPSFEDSMPPSSPPQQAAAAGLLAMLKSARPHTDTPTPAGPVHAQQDLEGIQLTTALLEVVLTFAHTIDGLSHLPGAQDILNPDIRTAARNFVAMSAASTAQPPLAPTQDINNDNTSSDVNMQGPQPTNLHHAQVSPAGPAADIQAVLTPAGNAAAYKPAQQANLSAPGTPAFNYNPYMAFNSLTEVNIGMGEAPFGAQGPRSKRLCTVARKAQRARASDNAQNMQGVMPMMARSPSTSDIFDAAEVLASLTSSPLASTGSSTFFNQPHTLKFDALEELAAAAAAAAAAAPGVSRTAPRSPKHSSDDMDWVAPKRSRKRSSTDAFATEESPAPQAAAAPVKAAPKRPAAKPRTMRKVDRKSPTGSFFQAEAQGVCPETLAAVRSMWQADASLPVFCQNKDSGVRAEGTFRIINGTKKIVLVSGPGHEPGTVMSPADFERVGDRLATKNWQLSVCVTGLTTKTGCTTELKLGHATRILGVH